jgi:hypothetical protein
MFRSLRAERAPFMRNETDPDLRLICCLSLYRLPAAGCRSTMMFGISTHRPSIVPAFPFLGLSVCFSRAFADGTRTSSTNPEASMWRFLSLCSVIRAKGWEDRASESDVCRKRASAAERREGWPRAATINRL